MQEYLACSWRDQPGFIDLLIVSMRPSLLVATTFCSFLLPGSSFCEFLGFIPFFPAAYLKDSRSRAAGILMECWVEQREGKWSSSQQTTESWGKKLGESLLSLLSAELHEGELQKYLLKTTWHNGCRSWRRAGSLDLLKMYCLDQGHQ